MSSGEACIANIGPRQRQRRLVGGLVALAIAAALCAWLIVSDAPRWWRLLLVLPLFGAASGVLQWREKT
jgi:hypothetical protein